MQLEVQCRSVKEMEIVHLNGVDLESECGSKSPMALEMVSKSACSHGECEASPHAS